MDKEAQQHKEQDKKSRREAHLLFQRGNRTTGCGRGRAHGGESFFLAGVQAALKKAHIVEACFGEFFSGGFGARTGVAQRDNGCIGKHAVAQGRIARGQVQQRSKGRWRGQACGGRWCVRARPTMT